VSAAPRGAPPGEVRIIGGRWRRSKLAVPARPWLRPTPERVRETLFNWLGQDLAGWRVLDAFAGSGALGFEAASRGAAEVVLLERDAPMCRALEASRQRLDGQALRVECVDALAWMRAAAPALAGHFDLVLLDPPFGAALLPRALAAAMPLLAAGGWLYVESGEALESLPAGLAPHRELLAGAVHAQLLRRTAAADRSCVTTVRDDCA